MKRVAGQQERNGFFVFLNSYRWLNWVLAVVLLHLGATPHVSPLTTVLVFAAVFLYNGVFTLCPQRVETYLRRVPALLLVDVLFCSSLLLVYGWGSPFYVYSFSPAMLAGYLFGLRGAFIVAALGSVGYVSSVSLTGKVWSEIAELGELDTHIAQAFDYFIVAVFFSYPAALAERLRRTNTDLHQAQLKIERLVLDKERQRVASEIHDGVTQSLMGLNLLVEDALKKSSEEPVKERLSLAQEAAAKAISQTRLAIDDLFEERLGGRSLAELAETVFEDLGRVHSIEAEFVVEGREEEVPADIKKALYMVLQEAVGNIIKHAHATRIDAKLCFQDHCIQLSISDNGSGFDPELPRTGYGLSTISNRVREIEGIFKLDSLAGRGTSILIRVPVSLSLSKESR